MSEPLIRVAGLRKAFGGVQALSDGTIDLRAGEVTALVGENGAGKSTLVKILTGVHRPDGGRIAIDGASVSIANPPQAQRLGICAVHQESVTFDDLSVAENIFIADPPMKHGALDWRAMRANASAILQTLRASIDVEGPAARLSIGEKHLVQIARALAQNARVVIFDEPTAALSHSETAHLLGIVARLRAEGRAILFISHKFEEIFAACDRYAVFRDGAAVGEGAIADATTDRLVSMMVGRDMSQIYPTRAAGVGAEILRVQGLSRRAEFIDVSFAVHAGEILGIYGLVGAGRSELAHALFGLTRPDAGRIIINGDEQTIASPKDAMRSSMAYVPEDRQGQGLALALSIEHNISLASLEQDAPGGFVRHRRAQRRARALASDLEIKAEALDAPASSLSGGNQQKVVLAKWLATNPRILLLDEPTKGVDIGAKAAVHARVRLLADQGVAVVMISSDLPEVLGMSDRIVAMRRGRVRGVLDRDKANAETIMRLATDA